MLNYFKRSRAWILKSKKSIKDYKVKNSEIAIPYFRTRRPMLEESLPGPVLVLGWGGADEGAGNEATLFLFTHWFLEF